MLAAVLVSLLSTASCVGQEPLSEEETGAASAELRICAAGPTVSGIDVSHWEGAINWDTVAASGVAFSFMKATQGTTYVDDTFATNWSETRRTGVMRGAYHFFCPKMDGVAQANHFLATMGAMESDDLPPVLDVEICPTATCGSACDWVGVSCATVVSRIQAFVDRVRTVTGHTPMIYTGIGTWEDTVCASPAFDTLPLWVANYGVTCPSVPVAWSDWDFWQTGDGGRVPGISAAVDMNVFNGDLTALRAFVGAAPVAPRCGDGACNGTETCTSCAGDCGACPVAPRCGDGTCNGGENCSTCSSDCGTCPVVPSCGDGACNGTETCSSCSGDCGSCAPRCGDGTCSGGENCSSCAGDCGTCPVVPSCGDGACSRTESCSSCAGDCGACAPPPVDAGPSTTPDAGTPAVVDAGPTAAADAGSTLSPRRMPRDLGLSGGCTVAAPGTSSPTHGLLVGAGLLMLSRARRRRGRRVGPHAETGAENTPRCRAQPVNLEDAPMAEVLAP